MRFVLDNARHSTMLKPEYDAAFYRTVNAAFDPSSAARISVDVPWWKRIRIAVPTGVTRSALKLEAHSTSN